MKNLGRSAQTAKKDAGTQGQDLSQIRTPIHISGKPVEQVINSIHYGSPELRCLLMDECNLIFECKVCRGLFRDLPNFISHKRAYCAKSFLEDRHVTIAQLPEEKVVVVQPQAPEETEKDLSQLPPSSSQPPKRPNLEQTIQRIQSGELGRSHAYKVYTEAAEKLQRQKEGMKVATIRTTAIPTNKNAVFIDVNMASVNIHERQPQVNGGGDSSLDTSLLHLPCPGVTRKAGDKAVQGNNSHPTRNTRKSLTQAKHTSEPQKLLMDQLKEIQHKVKQKAIAQDKVTTGKGKSKTSPKSNNSVQDTTNDQRKKKKHKRAERASDQKKPSTGNLKDLARQNLRSLLIKAESNEETNSEREKRKDRKSSVAEKSSMAQSKSPRKEAAQGMDALALAKNKKKLDRKTPICPKCNSIFATRKSLRFHKKIHHSAKRTFYPCPFCDSVFYYFFGITRHLSRNHNKTSEEIDAMRDQLRSKSYTKSAKNVSLNEDKQSSRSSNSKAGGTDDKKGEVTQHTSTQESRSERLKNRLQQKALKNSVRAEIHVDVANTDFPSDPSALSPTPSTCVSEDSHETPSHTCTKCQRSFGRKISYDNHFEVCQGVDNTAIKPETSKEQSKMLVPDVPVSAKSLQRTTRMRDQESSEDAIIKSSKEVSVASGVVDSQHGLSNFGKNGTSSLTLRSKIRDESNESEKSASSRNSANRTGGSASAERNSEGRSRNRSLERIRLKEKRDSSVESTQSHAEGRSGRSRRAAFSKYAREPTPPSQASQQAVPSLDTEVANEEISTGNEKISASQMITRAKGGVLERNSGKLRGGRKIKNLYAIGKRKTFMSRKAGEAKLGVAKMKTLRTKAGSYKIAIMKNIDHENNPSIQHVVDIRNPARSKHLPGRILSASSKSPQKYPFSYHKVSSPLKSLSSSSSQRKIDAQQNKSATSTVSPLSKSSSPSKTSRSSKVDQNSTPELIDGIKKKLDMEPESKDLKSKQILGRGNETQVGQVTEKHENSELSVIDDQSEDKGKVLPKKKIKKPKHERSSDSDKDDKPHIAVASALSERPERKRRVPSRNMDAEEMLSKIHNHKRDPVPAKKARTEIRTKNKISLGATKDSPSTALSSQEIIEPKAQTFENDDLDSKGKKLDMELESKDLKSKQILGGGNETQVGPVAEKHENSELSVIDDQSEDKGKVLHTKKIKKPKRERSSNKDYKPHIAVASSLSERPKRKRRVPSRNMDAQHNKISLRATKDSPSTAPSSQEITEPKAETSENDDLKSDEAMEDNESDGYVDDDEEEGPSKGKGRVVPNRIYVKSNSKGKKLKCYDQSRVYKLIDRENLKCLECGEQCSQVSNLRRHIIRVHLKWSRYKCKICKFESYDRSECTTHILRTHKKAPAYRKARSTNSLMIDLAKQGSHARSLKKTQTLKVKQQSESSAGNIYARPTVKRLPQLSQRAATEGGSKSDRDFLSDSEKESSTNVKHDLPSSVQSSPKSGTTSSTEGKEAKASGSKSRPFNISTRNSPRTFDTSPYTGDDAEDEIADKTQDLPKFCTPRRLFVLADNQSHLPGKDSLTMSVSLSRLESEGSEQEKEPAESSQNPDSGMIAGGSSTKEDAFKSRNIFDKMRPESTAAGVLQVTPDVMASVYIKRCPDFYSDKNRRSKRKIPEDQKHDQDSEKNPSETSDKSFPETSKKASSAPASAPHSKNDPPPRSSRSLTAASSQIDQRANLWPPKPQPRSTTTQLDKSTSNEELAKSLIKLKKLSDQVQVSSCNSSLSSPATQAVVKAISAQDSQVSSKPPFSALKTTAGEPLTAVQSKSNSNVSASQETTLAFNSGSSSSKSNITKTISGPAIVLSQGQSGKVILFTRPSDDKEPSTKSSMPSPSTRTVKTQGPSTTTTTTSSSTPSTAATGKDVVPAGKFIIHQHYI